MKNLIIIITASLLTSIFTIDAEAQLLNRLKKKAQDAAEQKVEEKITAEVQKAAEQMVENSWNAVFGEFSADSLSPGLPFTMSSDVKTEDTYHFDTITTMEIQTIKKNGEPEPPVRMDMHFNKDGQYTGTKFYNEEIKKEGSELFIIYDFKNAAMLMLMNNEKDQFSFAYEWEQTVTDPEEEVDQQNEAINQNEVAQWQGYSKIGQKQIAGYSCQGYLSETEDAKTEVWITQELSQGMGKMFSANANTKQMKGKIPEKYPTGMIMEMNSENLRNGDKTTMKVIDIKKNAEVSYKMSDYPIMSFGAKTEEN